MANKDVGRNPKKEIEIYLKKWDKLQKYPIQEEAIRELYDSMYSERFDEKALLVKCTVLNTFYSTMIFDIASVVTHFLKIKNIGKNILHNFYAVNPFFEKSKSIFRDTFYSCNS